VEEMAIGYLVLRNIRGINYKICSIITDSYYQIQVPWWEERSPTSRNVHRSSLDNDTRGRPGIEGSLVAATQKASATDKTSRP